MLDELKQHPLREQIASEIHARPVPRIDGAVTVVYLAFIKDKLEPQAPREHLASFLGSIDAPPLAPGEPCYYRGFQGGELRWESHQEFCSYLLIMPQLSTEAFPELRAPDWWGRLTATAPGQLINGIRLEIRLGAPPDDPLTSLPADFDSKWVYGSRVVDGQASVFTSFNADGDGLIRYLLFNESLSSFQSGRTSQRLLESLSLIHI